MHTIHKPGKSQLARLLGLLAIAATASGCSDGNGTTSTTTADDSPVMLYTDSFNLDDCTFSSTGANRYFILQPGFSLQLEGEDEGELIRVEISVLTEEQEILLDGGTRSVMTRVVEEREFIDGELFEVASNYFALCTETSDVFYFGEAVDFYENGVVIGHEGAWMAGEDGAQPGLIMPGRFLLGARYQQELAPGAAMDRGENAEMGVTIDTPAGSFSDCVLVLDSDGLEPDDEAEEKVHCPGIGLVSDEAIELVGYGF